MESRNTALRLSIDFGPWCFLQPNKSHISALKSWLSWWQVSSFQPPCPVPRLHPFSGSLTCLGSACSSPRGWLQGLQL